MMTELAPGAVTVADLYRVMSAMHTDVTKALERLAVIESRNQGADTIHADHEARVRVLESAHAAHADHEARIKALESAVPDSAKPRLVSLEQFRWKLAGALVFANGLAVLIEWYLWSHR